MRMKILFFSFFCIAFLATQNLTAQVKLPAVSTTQTIQQEFGLGTIEVTYSRPGAKGRKVFGDIVPYGKLWRTGANAATKITFSDAVELNGRKIDAGTYVLYTIPGEESWEIIINKGIKNQGTEGYKETEDVARFKVEPVKTKHKTEIFTIQFANIERTFCELQLMWEKKQVSIVITANVKEKIRSQIDAAMLTDKKPYWQAAQFYYEYDINLTKALENVSKASDANPTAYWIYLYKAKIQKDLGDNAGALKTSQTSMEFAKQAKAEDYIKMNKAFQKTIKKQ
jgi:hypothetical protein